MKLDWCHILLDAIPHTLIGFGFGLWLGWHRWGRVLKARNEARRRHYA